MPIIKGVAYTTLDGAKALVDEGLGKKSDFWVFVGYAGWAPRQLQGEVERDSWFLASADSGTPLARPKCGQCKSCCGGCSVDGLVRLAIRYLDGSVPEESCMTVKVCGIWLLKLIVKSMQRTSTPEFMVVVLPEPVSSVILRWSLHRAQKK